MSTFFGKEIHCQGERYPLDTDCYAPTGEDRSLCDQRLRKESLRLFQIAGGGINVLCSPRNNGPQKLPSELFFLPSEEVENYGISQHLQEESWQQIIFIIEPAFSWGHLTVTEPAFRNILASLRVFTPFLQVVHTFGAKTNDNQRANYLAYYYMQSSSYELCYNIRYFEKNRRGRGNPWSLRQTGVYQRSLNNKRSVWLLLNYSSYISERITAALEEGSNLTQSYCEASPLLLHLFILSAATRNWGLYIEDLRREVMTTEEKAFGSHINEKYLDNYKLLLSNLQEMMSLTDTITMAANVIAMQRDVLSKCTGLFIRLHRGGRKPCDCDMPGTLGTLRACLQDYHEAVKALSQTTSNTTQLLFAALSASQAKSSLQAATLSVKMAIAELKEQSRRTGLDTEQLLQVTTKGHNDATIIKILTQIATMFLPSSLIASLFGSSIFSNSSDNISSIGLYFIITVPILLATLLFLVFLERGLPSSVWLQRLDWNLV